MFVPFRYCPAPGDIQNVPLPKLLGEFPKLLQNDSEQSTIGDTGKTSSVVPHLSEHHKEVDSLQHAKAAYDSCLTSSYTQLVWLREFYDTTSSTGDGSQGGILTQWQRVIIKPEWQQRIIILTIPAPNADLDIPNVWSNPPWDYARNYQRVMLTPCCSNIICILFKMNEEWLLQIWNLLNLRPATCAWNFLIICCIENLDSRMTVLWGLSLQKTF